MQKNLYKRKNKNEEDDKLAKFISTFSSITLNKLNEKAAMLERSENKYIFALKDLNIALQDLRKEFDILEIDEKKVFRYESVYFDDENNICYTHHHQGKRQRFKVRTRRYVDADLYFFEVKLKDKRNKTSKKRYICTKGEHGVFTDKSQDLVQKNFLKLYKKDFHYKLSPSNVVSYKRITLVAKKGSERLTIDHDLKFDLHKKNSPIYAPKNFIIVETKSTDGNGIADKIFKKNKHRSKSCSKFCLSKIVLGQAEKYNSFRPLLKKYFPELIKNNQPVFGF